MNGVCSEGKGAQMAEKVVRILIYYQPKPVWVFT